MDFKISLISSKKHKIFTVIMLILLLNACNPAVATTTPAAVHNSPTEVQQALVQQPTPAEPTPVPTTSAIEERIFPQYLPLATKLENISQTINGVTTVIEWAYVDEARVAIQYTISGLDWPDGSTLDAMQQVQMSSATLSSFRLGGFSGAGGANVGFSEDGVITGSSDQALLDGALDAEKYPNINLNVKIPVEGPTKIGVFQFNFTVPVMNGIKIDDIDQIVVANDVSMILKSLILNPSHAQAVICFQMPSEADWGLTASTIAVGDRNYPFSGGGLVFEEGNLDSALMSPERCNELGFDITFDAKSDTSITLTVPRLMASVNEVVTQETVEIANNRLADQGIEFDYENVDHGGNFVILKRPDNATDAEIYPLIWDALAEQYEGPWVFTVEIPK